MKSILMFLCLIGVFTGVKAGDLITKEQVISNVPVYYENRTLDKEVANKVQRNVRLLKLLKPLQKGAKAKKANNNENLKMYGITFFAAGALFFLLSFILTSIDPGILINLLTFGVLFMAVGLICFVLYLVL